MAIEWTVRAAQRERAHALSRAVGVQPLTAQLLLNRGVRSATEARRFLSPQEADHSDPLTLPDMDRAVARLRRAIASREPILIFGDSDVDGLTATAILYEVLRSLGAHVRAKLSNRIEDGYGLCASTTSQIARTTTRLVVLLDCGTNQVAEVAHLTARGIDVLIIDHHLPLESPARPTAFVNPHRTGGDHRELCSAGLAFKVAQALLGPDAPDRLAAYLDLAALGTLADYVPLLGESRLIAVKGLPRITSSLRPGLSRLCEATQTRQASPDQVIRRLVPRLNAFGRLGDPTTAWHLLLAQDDDRLEAWLAEAQEAHATTKQLQRRITGEAQEQVNRLHFRDQYVLIVSRSGWHQGLMGPLASQLAARYGRPAIAIAMDEDRGTGSARSIPQFNLLEVLRSCQDLLERFGGHAQACGLTVEHRNLAAFRTMVNECAQRSMGRAGLVQQRTMDLELPLGAVTSRWVSELKRLAPFGPGNPRPTVLLRRVAIEPSTPRTAWLTDGTTRMAAKGRLPEVSPGAWYDVEASCAMADGGEVVLTVRGAKASSAPSAPARISGS